jgi:malate synthase
VAGSREILMRARDGVEIRGPLRGRAGEVLTDEAVGFVGLLHREFAPARERLLARRAERWARIRDGEVPDFLPGTRAIREGSWTVAPVPPDLRDRRVEITGPVDRKMMINALNSGASTFMADFEDAISPTWDNLVIGQANLVDAVRGTIAYTSPDGRTYRLGERVATLLVRPRGWHLWDAHLHVDGRPVTAALLDAGLYLFHNAEELLSRGSGPYLYLPKLESHLEARLWHDVLTFAEDLLGLPRGCVRTTVLVEHVLAAFEMEEILYELRDRAGGLNAGRWDYIYSLIKTFRHRPDAVLPDRAQVTMTVPFMHAYTELLVRTCHRRGAYAIGGMAAYIPNRRDPQANEAALARVREDKVREAGQGFDGTWVAHPDLVPVALEVFARALQGKPHQLDRTREDVRVRAGDLLDVRVPGGAITEAGLRNNLAVGLRYLTAWLHGVGASAIFNLMEDTATAEIARSQVWQWVHHGARLQDGRPVTRELVRRIADEEVDRFREEIGDDSGLARRLAQARDLLEHVALDDPFVEFLTFPGYAILCQEEVRP